jgi:Ca2+-binding EF-hand superfamily protein
MDPWHTYGMSFTAVRAVGRSVGSLQKNVKATLPAKQQNDHFEFECEVFGLRHTCIQREMVRSSQDLVDVFASNGSEKTARVESRITSSTITRQFDKIFRTFVYCVEGVGNAAISFPKDGKTEPLRIPHPFLAIQLYVPASQLFSFEVTCMDYFGSRRTILFSTSCKQPGLINLQTGKLPLKGMVRNVWVNLVIDLQDVFSGLFDSFKFELLESISIRPTCRLRRIFTLRTPPPDTTCAGDGGKVLEGEFEPLPSSYELPAHVDSVTQILSLHRCIEDPGQLLEKQSKGKKMRRPLGLASSLGAEPTYMSTVDGGHSNDKENENTESPRGPAASSGLDQENRDLRSQLIVYRDQLNTMMNQWTLMKERLTMPEDQENLQISALQKQLKMEKSTAHEYYTKLAHAKHVIDEQAAELQDLRVAKEATKDKVQRHAARVKELEQEREWLAEQIHQRDEAYKVALTAEQRAVDAIALAEETQHRLEEVERQKELLSMKARRTKKRSEEFERQLHGSRTQSGEATDDNEDDFNRMQATHEKVKEQREQLASLLQAEQERRGLVEEQAQSSTRELQAVRHQNHLLREEVGVVQSKLEEAEREISSLQQQLAQVRDELAATNEQWEAEHTLRYHSQERQYLESIEALKTKIRELERNLQLSHVQRRDLLQQNLSISSTLQSLAHQSAPSSATAAHAPTYTSEAHKNMAHNVSSEGVKALLAQGGTLQREATPPLSDRSHRSTSGVGSHAGSELQPTAERFHGTPARSAFEAASTMFADADAIFGKPAAVVAADAAARAPARVRRPTWENFRGGMETLRRLHGRMQAASYTMGGQDWPKLFKKIDKDHGGTLSFAELLKAVRMKMQIPHTDVPDFTVREFFRILDEDSSGEIDVAELVAFLKHGPVRSTTINPLDPSVNLAAELPVPSAPVQEERRTGRMTPPPEPTDDFPGISLNITDTHRSDTPEEAEDPRFVRRPPRFIEPRFADGHAPSQRHGSMSSSLLRKLHAKLHKVAFDLAEGGADYTRLFRLLDKNRDSKLSCNDLVHAVRSVLQTSAADVSDALLESFHASLDQDQAGNIDIHDLLHFLRDGPLAVEHPKPSAAPPLPNQPLRRSAHARGQLGAHDTGEPKTLEQRLQRGEDAIRLGMAQLRKAGALHSHTGHGDKRLSLDVLTLVHRKMQAAAYTHGGQDWKKLFTKMDTDHGGLLSLPEWESAVRKYFRIPLSDVSSDVLAKLFSTFDQDDSGNIAVEELIRFLETGPQYLLP